MARRAVAAPVPPLGYRLRRQQVEHGGGQVGAVGDTALDYAGLFAGLPTAYLVMDLDLVIVEANAAYEQLLGHRREDLVGRWVFDAFPPTPDALDDQGRNPLQLSFETARDTGEPDAMPLFKYDVALPGTGEVVERYWSLVSAPLKAADGEVVLVLQRVEDVTDYVRDHEGQQAQARLGQARVQAVEADLFLRVQQLRDAQEARDLVARRLARLNEVALALAAADSLEDLEQIVVGQGLTVLGADGGGIVSAAEDGGWRLTISASIAAPARAKYAHLPHDSALPACVVARTGTRLELPTVAAGLACTPLMAAVYEETGRRGWVFLPLTVKGECLGALAVAWVQERRLLADELTLLEGFAAQCAQTLSRLEARAAERRAAATDRRMSETLQRSLLTAPVQPDHLQVAVRYVPAVDDAQVGGDWYDAFLTAEGLTSSGDRRRRGPRPGRRRGHGPGAQPRPGRRPRPGRAPGGRAAPARPGPARPGGRGAGDRRPGAGRPGRGGPGAGPAHTALVQRRPPAAAAAAPRRPDELLRTEPDLLLGLDPGTPRTDHEVEVPPGTTVLLYTDGLVERRDASLEDGLQWLTGAVQELAGLELEALCDALLECGRGGRGRRGAAGGARAPAGPPAATGGRAPRGALSPGTLSPAALRPPPGRPGRVRPRRPRPARPGAGCGHRSGRARRG